jgi:alpha-mannosidase
MPQVLRKAGLKYYYFARCGKGDPIFNWQGIDGSQILAYCGGNITAGGYGGDPRMSDVAACNTVKEKYGIKQAMSVYGVGDAGGGPTREHIEDVLSIDKTPFLPQAKFGTAEQYFDLISKSKPDFPVINDELNFIFEGCYTTHGDIKRITRESEVRAVTAEKLATIAGMYGYKYPIPLFRSLWEDICWNHHHDTIDGSAIHSSYELSHEKFNRIVKETTKIQDDSIKIITSQLKVAQKGSLITVFNPLNWTRDDYVELQTNVPADTRVIDAKGNETVSAVIDKAGKKLVTFVATGVPSLGYKTYYLQSGVKPEQAGSVTVDQTNWTAENEYYKLKLDVKTGYMTSLFDKMLNKELIEQGGLGNLLQVLYEQPNQMSAWTIGSINKTVNLDSTPEMKVVEQNAVKSVIEIKRSYSKSTFTQRIVLYTGINRIDFPCTVDWYEQSSSTEDCPMLKVSFQLNINSQDATYETPFGHIDRLSNGNEYPSIKWVDVSDNNGSFGVSLLNNCKYGYDVKQNVLRLTLLRASYTPDPEPDKGTHEFTYSLYSHPGDWKQAKVIRRGYEVNHKLASVITELGKGTVTDTAHSFVSIDNYDNLVITGVKKSESGDAVIVRFYETDGKKVDARIKFDFSVKKAYDTDLIEGLIYKNALTVDGNSVIVPTNPYEIKTVRLELQ